MSIRTKWAILFAVAVLPLGGACNIISSPFKQSEWDEHDVEITARDARIKKLSERIKAAQGQVGCKNSGQCRVAGLGAKLCGGDSNFLVYSITDVKENVLLPLIEEFNREAEELNKISLNVGRCGVSPKAPSCVDGHCAVL